jgi:hypothetical protein
MAKIYYPIDIFNLTKITKRYLKNNKKAACLSP